MSEIPVRVHNGVIMHQLYLMGYDYSYITSRDKPKIMGVILPVVVTILKHLERCL